MVIKMKGEFFNVKDTLECGQIFRFIPYNKGYKVYSKNKCAYVYNEGDFAFIDCMDADEDYFRNFFDLDRDYSKIYNSAINEGGIIKKCAILGKGIRILNQDTLEALFSFIVSQNNNIPRIKSIIEKLCSSLGDRKDYLGEYYSFPTVNKLAEKDEKFFFSLGLGYRAPYIFRLATDIISGLNIEEFKKLNTIELKKKLISIYGVGPKVCDCVSLFGFHRSDSFPVDTWIEKVYVEDFKGTIKDRKKIAEWFVDKFKENSGYFQQYLFYYKRSLEKK